VRLLPPLPRQPEILTSGSADAVLAPRYLDVGFSTFVFDIPPPHADLQKTAVVFEGPRQRAQGLGGPSR
jgi:hypothetical protein